MLNLLTQDKIALLLPSVPEANPRSTFDIEYRTPTSSWQRVPGNPSITQPQLPVDNLQPNTPYTFRVRYYDPARREESPWSRVETITTDRECGVLFMQFCWLVNVNVTKTTIQEIMLLLSLYSHCTVKIMLP